VRTSNWISEILAEVVATGEEELEALGVALELAELDGFGVPEILALFLPISDLAAAEVVAPPSFSRATQET